MYLLVSSAVTGKNRTLMESKMKLMCDKHQRRHQPRGKRLSLLPKQGSSLLHSSLLPAAPLSDDETSGPDSPPPPPPRHTESSELSELSESRLLQAKLKELAAAAAAAKAKTETAAPKPKPTPSPLVLEDQKTTRLAHRKLLSQDVTEVASMNVSL